MSDEEAGMDARPGFEKYQRPKPNFGPGLSANVNDSFAPNYAKEGGPKILDANFERLEILLMDFKSARQSLMNLRVRLLGYLPEQETSPTKDKSPDQGILLALSELTTNLEQELKDLLHEISYLQQL